MRYFDRYRAAAALVLAFFRGTAYAAENSGVTQRAVQKWRGKLGKDRQLKEIHDRLMEQVLNDWSEKLPLVLASTLDFLDRASKEADHTDPDAIEAVTKALSALSEIHVLQLELKSREIDSRPSVLESLSPET